MVVGENLEFHATCLVNYLIFLHDAEDLALGTLFYHTNILNSFYPRQCRTIKDRYLGGIKFNQTVVNSEAIKGSHGMFDGRNRDVAFLDDCATVGGSNIVGNGFDDGFTLKVDALESITGIRF